MRGPEDEAHGMLPWNELCGMVVSIATRQLVPVNDASRAERVLV